MPADETRVASLQFLPKSAVGKYTGQGKRDTQQGLMVLGSSGTAHILALSQDSAASLGTLHPKGQAVVAMAAAPSGKYAALATSDGSIFLYDLAVLLKRASSGAAARSKLLAEAFPGSPSSFKTRSALMPLLKKRARRNAHSGTADPRAAPSKGRSGSGKRSQQSKEEGQAIIWQRTGPPGHVNQPPAQPKQRAVRVPGRGVQPLAKVDSNRGGRTQSSKNRSHTSAPVPAAPSVSAAAAGSMQAGPLAAKTPGNARTFAMAHLRSTVAVACGVGRGGGLPAPARLDAWRLALALPGNKTAFDGACSLPLPPMQDSIVKQACISSPRLDRQLRSTMACLLQWCPDLAHVSHLAETVFPFVRMWGVDGPSAAETCMVFWGTWGKRWLETLPLPPTPLLGAVWAQLELVDAELADHLLRCGADASVVLWPMMKSVFSDVLVDDAWVAVWDTLAMFAADASLLPLAAIAITTLMRTTLMSVAVAAHAPPKGKAAADWAAHGRVVDPDCPQTAAIARVLGSATPLRAKDIVLRMWELRRGCKGVLLDVLQCNESGWGGCGPPPIGFGATDSKEGENAPPAGAGDKPVLHTRKDGLVLSKMTVARPAQSAAQEPTPFPAPPSGVSTVWVPHPCAHLGTQPGIVLPKADQYAPLPGGYLPIAHAQHAQDMWQAISDAEAATVQRKAVASELKATAEEAQAAAAAERASGITAAGAAARQARDVDTALRLQQQQRAHAEAAARSSRVQAETALHAARRDLIAARNAAAAAAASSSDERAAVAAADWDHFATQRMAEEEALSGRLAAELKLVQAQYSSVRDQLLTSELAAESAAAKSRSLQQVAMQADMRSQDEAERMTAAIVSSEAERSAQQELRAAAARTRQLEEEATHLTAEAAMAGVRRHRTLRQATTQAHTSAARTEQRDAEARYAEQRAASQQLAEAQAARNAAEQRVKELTAQQTALQQQVQALKAAQEEHASQSAHFNDSDVHELATGLASFSDVDRAVEAAVWRSAAALTTRPSVSHDVSPAQGTPVLPSGSPASQRSQLEDAASHASEEQDGEAAGAPSANTAAAQWASTTGPQRGSASSVGSGTGEPSGTRGVRRTPVKSASATAPLRMPARSPFVPQAATPAQRAQATEQSPASSTAGSAASDEDWLGATQRAAGGGRALPLHAPNPPPGMATFHAAEGARMALKGSPLAATFAGGRAPRTRTAAAGTQAWYQKATPMHADMSDEPSGDELSEGGLEADSLGGTFEAGQEAAAGGMLRAPGTSAQEAAATADIAQLIAKYSMAVRGSAHAAQHEDESGSDASDSSGQPSDLPSSHSAQGTGNYSSGTQGLRYQPLPDDSDDEYDEESAAADMAMQAAALGSEMFSPGAGYDVPSQTAMAGTGDAEWLDSSSGSGSSAGDATFQSLLATSLSPVPEGAPKRYGAPSRSEDSSLAASPLSAVSGGGGESASPAAAPAAASDADSQDKGRVEFGVAIMDAAGSFDDNVQVRGGRWVHQEDFLSGSAGGGEVVREHVRHVKEAVRDIETATHAQQQQQG